MPKKPQFVEVPSPPPYHQSPNDNTGIIKELDKEPSPRRSRDSSPIKARFAEPLVKGATAAATQSKQLGTKWITRTTIHGLDELLESHSWHFRIVWGILLLAATALLLRQIILLTIKYNQSTVSTEIRTTELEFYPPSVIYCTSQAFNETKLRQLGVTPNGLLYVLSIYGFGFTAGYRVMDNVTKHQIASWGARDIDNVFRKLYYLKSFEEFMDLIRNDPIDLVKGWHHDNISKIETIRGPCYDIQLSPKRSMDKRLDEEVFTLYFANKPLSPEYLSMLDGTLFKNDFFWLRFGQMDVDILGDTSTDMTARGTRRQLQNTKNHHCIEAATQHDNDFCQIMCHNEINARCMGCIWYYNTTVMDNYRFCTFHDDLERWWNDTKIATCFDDNDDDLQRCYSECRQKEPCDFWSYEVVPTPAQYRSIQGSFRGQMDTTRYRIVNIKVMTPYSSSFIVEIPAYTFEQYFSDLGGSMGLFIGASVISFVQLLFYVCCVPLERSMRRRQIVRRMSSRLGRRQDEPRGSNTL